MLPFEKLIIKEKKMNIIVTYKSKTGFTKKYAQWIAEDLGCKAVSLSELSRVSEYDVVIHGGWIMGGTINGFEEIKKRNPKKLIVFGVGSTIDANYVDTIKEVNKITDIPVYYFKGGMNPEKMGFFSKLIVKMVSKEKPQYKDLTDKASIEGLVSYVKSLDK